MRTTLTLDDDVAAELEALRRRDRRAFKELVNDLLRRGLREREAADEPQSGPYTQPVALGPLRIASLDDVSEAIVVAEGDEHR